MTRLAVACLTILLAATVALAADPVTVNKAGVTVARKVFDPKNPPRDMPPVTAEEAGLCHYAFSTRVAITADIEVVSDGRVTIIPAAVTVNVSMPVTIYIAKDAPKRIEEHEDGHLAICEYYYANIDTYAKRAGEARIGKSFPGAGKDKQAAIDDAMNTAIAEINNEIMGHTQVRAAAANERYDKITDHSRKPGSQAEAVKQAVSEDPELVGGKLPAK
jgi:hypothetical protein